MSDISEAFDDSLDAQEEALSLREKCIISGSEHDFLVGDTNLVSIPVDGGNADSGAFIGKIRLSEFPSGLPKKYDLFEFRGKTLKILEVNRVNETLEIIAGDPAETE